MDSRSYFLLTALFLSVSPLIFSIVARRAIMLVRQRQIISLNDFFERGDCFKAKASPSGEKATRSDIDDEQQSSSHGQDDKPYRKIVKSLEFLKFKYGLRSEPKEEEFGIKPPENEPHAWAISGLLLAITLLVLLSLAALAANGLVCDPKADGAICIEVYFGRHPSVSLTLLAAIAGAYTYMVRAFHQAVHNFDLEPSSFFGAASNLVFAVVVTEIAVFYLAKSAEAAHTGTALLMIAAFIGAYMPDDILRYFLSLSSIKQLKQERSNFGTEIQGIPVEVIDGIDGKVRYRLSDFHIEDVQHLASANPLMLFVETPYGFYQTLDWVGQAQLCASVGPDALFKLRRFGIRTIFDLERAVLSEGFGDGDLRQAIAPLLLPDHKTGSPIAEATIEANVRIRVDGSDTRRLRQIVNCVNKRLGPDSAALL